MKRIVVLGDIMVDSTWHCNVNRLSPEAPVPVASVISKTETLGGAANVAYNIAKIGNSEVQVFLGGWLGVEYKHLIENTGIVLWHSGYTTGKRTNIKLRIVDKTSNYHMIRVDNEEINRCQDFPLPAATKCNWLPGIQPEIVMCSDYITGASTKELAQMWIKQKEYFNSQVIVDTRIPSYPHMYEGADYITPNKKEIMKFLGRTKIETKDLVGFIKLMGLQGLLLTLSENGMMLLTEEEVFEQKALNTSIIDVTGAGDTALATFAIATAFDIPLSKRLIYANYLASEVCMSPGTTVPKITWRDLLTPWA